MCAAARFEWKTAFVGSRAIARVYASIASP
jgi:hypothetical protein